MDWFIGLLLGHLVGDYVLQNSWMALNKKHYKSICTLHCAIYTTCVCAGLALFNITITPLLILGIFISHIVLDATNLVDKWMKFYGISTFTDCVPRKENNKHDEVLDWNSKMSASQVVQTTFGAFCYIIVDNTLHLVMMVVFIKYFILG